MAMLNNQMVYQLQFESIPIDPIVLMVKNHKEPKKKTYVKICVNPHSKTPTLAMRVRLAAQAARLFQQMRALPVRNVAPPDAFPARGGLYHVLDYIYI
jgi:hypothetical protein